MDDVFKNMPERDREALMDLMGADPEEYKRARAAREKIEKEIAEQRRKEWAEAVSKAFAEKTDKSYKVDGPKHFVFPKDLELQESKEIVRVPRSWAQEKAAIELLEEQRRLRRTQQAAWEQRSKESQSGQNGGAAYFAEQFKEEAEAYETALEIIGEKRKKMDLGDLTEPCEVCNGKKTLYQHTNSTKLFIDTLEEASTLVTECMACPPYAHCCMKGISANSAFKINFCPECGRPLTTEAWAMMAKRLRGIMV